MSITTRNIVKDEYLIVVDDNTADKHYFETSADQVTLEDADGNYNATDVEQAFREVAAEIASVKKDVESAGKVDDVVNEDGTSIVVKKVAQMKDAVVKEAGKVKNTFSYTVHNKDKGTKVTIGYDGSKACSLDFDIDDFDPVYTSGQDLGVKIKDKGYAKKTDVDTALDKKLDKAGGTVTGDLVVQGNLAIKGTTTTVDTQTLEVKDNLIVVAKDNTTALTTPAGMYVPKYDGANNVALVVDNDGMAKVGNAVLDSSGNIDKSKSSLQTLATRTGLVDENIVKYDGTNQTLVDTGKKVSDFATSEQGATADSALEKATTNEEQIGKIINGTQTVGKATMVTTYIGSTARTITSVFEGDTSTVKEATHAGSADSSNKVAHGLAIRGKLNASDAVQEIDFDGSAARQLDFEGSDFKYVKTGGTLAEIRLQNSGVTAGTYTALQVDAKGRATAGNRAFAVIGATDDIPSDVMIGGFILRAKA